MFEYKQQTGNKRIAIIFVSVFGIVLSLVVTFDLKTLVTWMWVLMGVVAYIAYMMYRHFGTTLSGQNLIKPSWHEDVNWVNLKVTASESERATIQHDLAYQAIGEAHMLWKERVIKRKDYLSDRDAFYSYLRQQVLTDWLKAGGEKAVFMEAMVQYARNDWVSAGGRVEDFERQLQAARRNSK
jgi:hypothetical protein